MASTKTIFYVAYTLLVFLIDIVYIIFMSYDIYCRLLFGYSCYNLTESNIHHPVLLIIHIIDCYTLYCIIKICIINNQNIYRRKKIIYKFINTRETAAAA